MTAYVDISKLPENQRIKAIGKLVTNTRQSAWCLTDDEPGKIERYKKKMTEWFPELKLGEIKRAFPAEGCGGFTVHPSEHGLS